MSFFAHATHVFLPDKDTGRLIASAMLRSEYSIVISKPYGKWINGYLPMGLSYKDVKDFPTATCLELNCYEDESLEIKFFTSDRLAFQFESGIAEAAEKEEELLSIAQDLWAKDHPELVEKIRAAHESAARKSKDSEDDLDEGADLSAMENVEDFWSLSDEARKPYLEKAKNSDDYLRFTTQKDEDDELPDATSMSKIIPEGKTLDELQNLLLATLQRGKGAPENEQVKATIEKYMGGKSHSTEPVDYLKAFAAFFEVRGSAWSLETIQEKLEDKIDRRIISLEDLESAES